MINDYFDFNNPTPSPFSMDEDFATPVVRDQTEVLNIPQVTGLLPIGASVPSIQGVTDDPVAEAEQQTLLTSSSADTRIRLRCMRGQEQTVYGAQAEDNILSILHETDGLLFPYTPTVNVSQTTNYETTSLTHTNGDIQSYSNTPSVTIQLTGKFTVQNQREGRYLLASLHMLRVVSKMYFGERDKASGLAGMPPPVMVFTGYGNYMFNDLPVIVKGHSYSLDDQADTVVINTAGGVARLPSIMTIAIELVVQQTPVRQRKNFSLDDFRTGKLMRDSTGGSGWI